MKLFYLSCLFLSSCHFQKTKEELIPKKMDLYAWCAVYQVGDTDIFSGCSSIVALSSSDIVDDRNNYLSLTDSIKLSKINSLLSDNYVDTLGLSYDCRLSLVFTYKKHKKDTLSFYNGYILNNRAYKFNVLDSILLTCGYRGIYTTEMKEAFGKAWNAPPNILMK